MKREVLVLDHWAPLCVPVVAPKAKAHRSAGGEIGAPTLALRPRLLANWRQHAHVNLYCTGHNFCGRAVLFGMFSTRTKLNRAIAMVVALHREAADAFAVFCAVVFVPGDIAIM